MSLVAAGHSSRKGGYPSSRTKGATQGRYKADLYAPYTDAGIDNDTARAATLTVCGLAKDKDDAKMLLMALGLMNDPESKETTSNRLSHKSGSRSK